MRISDWSSDVCSSDLIQGSAGCNRFNGEYQERRDTLIAGQLAVTRMMCQGNAMTVESRFLKILGGPVTVQQRGQTLTLSSRSEERRVGKECVSPGRSRWSPEP